MPSRANHLRATARECRSLARAAKNDDVRVQLAVIAWQYDRMADRYEEAARAAPTVMAPAQLGMKHRA